MMGLLENVDIVIFVVSFLLIVLYLYRRKKSCLFDDRGRLDILRIVTLLILTGTFGSISLCVSALLLLILEGSWPLYIPLERVGLSILLLSTFGLAFIISQILGFVHETISPKGRISEDDDAANGDEFDQQG